MYYKIKQKKSARKMPSFRPGQITPITNTRNSGGPANAGARSDKTANKLQPNFRTPSAVIQNPQSGEFENDYFGHAAPSRTPDLSGMPANNFRTLGDIHGSRG